MSRRKTNAIIIAKLPNPFKIISLIINYNLIITLSVKNTNSKQMNTNKFNIYAFEIDFISYQRKKQRKKKSYPKFGKYFRDFGLIF